MRSVMIELNSKYDFNIKDTIDSWIMQRCTIVLKVTRNYATALPAVSVEFYNKLDEKQYYIPVTYTTESKLDFNVTWTNFWLTPWRSKIEIFFEKNEWIILNLQQAGKYAIKNLYLYCLYIYIYIYNFKYIYFSTYNTCL